MSDNAFPLPGVTSVSTIGDWESLFYPAFATGVIPGVGAELAPSLDLPGRNVVIGTGAAVIRAFYKPVSASTPTAIPAASGQNRIDRLVLRLDRTQTDPAQFIVPVVLAGTPGSNPQPPAVTQTATGIWDLPLCSWTSASSGALSGLTDERDFTGGPLIAGVSTGHHTPGRPGLRIDKDTGELLMSVNGTSWNSAVYHPDDPWAPFNPLSNGWNVQSSGAYAQVHLSRDRTRVELSAYRLTPGNVNNGTVVAVLNGKYRPRSPHQWAVAADILALTDSTNGKGARFRLESNGNLTAWGISTFASEVSFEVSVPLSV